MVSPVNEIVQNLDNRSSNGVVQDLTILDISVIGSSKSRVLKSGNISRANE